MFTAELENLTNLQPRGGRNADNFRYNFKLKCGKCGEITQKETYVSLGETVYPPLGKGHTHLVQKGKFCSRDGTVTMITGRGHPLTHGDSQTGTYAPLMVFECRGFEPLDFVFRGKWKAESLRAQDLKASICLEMSLLSMMRRGSVQ
ncbi:hypothetical protein K7X08_028561 [Anisodus acutangulus]|uniref:Uncharacterized protein n=1 Tax=Anisodus acutangulus TaxID=402998 RepID=A0A9Q1M8X6_9SOLA|nr:hypothetical protein K7X08_028561 [Anisodus acutangulus]